MDGSEKDMNHMELVYLDVKWILKMSISRQRKFQDGVLSV